MGVLNDLLVKFENEKVRVLLKAEDGSFEDAPDTIEINVEEGDRVRWSFVGMRLQILFGTNVPAEGSSLRAPEEPDLAFENTPFSTDDFIAEGNSDDFTQNGAIFPEVIAPLSGAIASFEGEGQGTLEVHTFKYTINLTHLDGMLHTLDPHIRRVRLRRNQD